MQERRVFDRLRSDVSDEAKYQYEYAIKDLLQRYNTTIHENRFIVGGAVEVFTYALLKSVGIDCTLYGDQSKHGDILLPNDRKLSIKGSFVGGVTSIKLMNKLGGGLRAWTTATLFVISEVGIVYGSPDMVEDKHIQDTRDGTMLTRAGLNALVNDESNLLEMNIERKPPTEMTGFSHKASTAVARQILQENEADRLLKAFRS
ncbi:MAG: hypothetical protein OXG02_06725 [Chloroflexi bacterium]|nr:hypothetical protein [Chloroflexota bacterium]